MYYENKLKYWYFWISLFLFLGGPSFELLHVWLANDLSSFLKNCSSENSNAEFQEGASSPAVLVPKNQFCWSSFESSTTEQRWFKANSSVSSWKLNFLGPGGSGIMLGQLVVVYVGHGTRSVNYGTSVLVIFDGNMYASGHVWNGCLVCSLSATDEQNSARVIEDCLSVILSWYYLSEISALSCSSSEKKVWGMSDSNA